MKFDMSRDRRTVEQEKAVFALEVTRVLECHVRMYKSKLGHLQIYNHEWPAESMKYFSENTMKAVFTLAYLFRAQCNDLYRKNCDRLKTRYHMFLMAHTIPSDRYFVRFLTWLSFAFEMTMCCYRNEFSANKVNPEFYIDVSKQCLEDYPNMNVLLCRERESTWWNEIQEAANHIAAFYTFVRDLMIRCKTHDIIPPLQVVLKDLLKLHECNLKMTEIATLRCDPNSKYDLKRHVYPLSQYDPKRIVLGHTVTRKNKLADKSWLNSKKFFTMSERALSSHVNVQAARGPSTSSGVCNANVSLSDVLDKEYFQFDSYKKSAFVIGKNKLKRIKSGKNSCKQDIKIYCPRKQIMGKVENLYSVLEEHIANYSNTRISDNLFLVNLRHDIDKESSEPIIVVDSSSEEEDDDKFDSLQRSLIDGMLQKCKEFSLHDIEAMNFALSSGMGTEGTVGIYHYSETRLNVMQPEPHR